MNNTNFLGRFRLDGRVILVTGATGHLGAPIARAIADAGGTPILSSRNEARLDALRDEIVAAGGTCSTMPCDVGDPAACRRVMNTLESIYGVLHGIVNCAYGGRPATLDAALDEDFDLAFRQNLSGPFALIQSGLPLLRRGAAALDGGASIVNIASMYGHVSPDPRIYGTSGKNNPPYYGAAKAGLLQLTRYLACHLGADNIRVNSISPGAFPPADIKTGSPDFHRQLAERIPLGRIGVAPEVAGPTLFLLSPAASFINGADLAVDGGWTAW